MLRIGLTGGIASGKSTVARLFAQCGATVIDADGIAREVVEPGRPALASLVQALGREILAPDGHIDRQRLRERIFQDAATRRVVEQILHPAILAELQRQAAAADGPYQVLVIPLLVEAGRHRLVDRVLVVDCPEQQQIERLMRRDGESRAGAARALAAQATRAERLAAADDVIANNGAPETLASRVAELDRRYRQLAAEKPEI
jgi:dephospho-CoA kinase